MANIFLDTSALMRRYHAAEPGANRIRVICAPTNGNTIMLSRLAPVELAAALNRRVRDRTLPALERNRHWAAFGLHLQDQYRVVQITEEVFAIAQRLVFAHALRTLDAMQLASALVVRERQRGLVFWTADDQQAAAARTEGLGVEQV